MPRNNSLWFKLVAEAPVLEKVRKWGLVFLYFVCFYLRRGLADIKSLLFLLPTCLMLELQACRKEAMINDKRENLILVPAGLPRPVGLAKGQEVPKETESLNMVERCVAHG